MTSRPTPLPADERRAATIEAVVALAAEQNPGDITTAAIAHRMGLTQGALFRHFPNKDAIIESVMQWAKSRLLAQLDQASSAAATPLAALEAMFMAHVAFVIRHPGIPRMLFGELQRPGDTLPKRMVQTLTQGYSQRLRDLLEAGIHQHEIDPALDLDAAAILFIGMIQGLVMQSLIAGNVSNIRKQAPHVFDLYRKSIRSRQ